ncbi:hypothetical protein HD806DRAFT_526253 [Xylariaceae sp. AK1471]|nr:hypothetical protein HD806DRAFT_526253 [Xylariaceae sp. AK1471]
MEQPPDRIQSELESFRQRWREEVSSRSKNPATSPSSSQQPQQHQQSRLASQAQAGPSTSSASNRQARRHEPPSHNKGPPTTPSTSKIGQLDDDDDYVPAPVFEDNSSTSKSLKGGQTLEGEDEGGPKEPKTAIEFYENAVERESTGKLGDSLQLYRKAFRMDDKVDRKYRDKHFSGRWAKQQTNPSNAAVTVPNTAHHSLEGGGGGGSDEVTPLSFPDLIASFANLKVEGAPPECEGVEPPPCPMAALPDEILVHILCEVAIADVGDFVRLAQVCKRLAYLAITEDQIWRRVCVGLEFGFGGMHHHWQRAINWAPLNLTDMLTDSISSEDEVFTLEEIQQRREAESYATTLALFRSVGSGYPSWQAMFRRRPRVRFNGCYISTVNYIRPGQNLGQHLTWNTPVHIVTYYRYLRLFRDGTAISLTTTDEPAQVVHHLTRDNLALHRGNTTHQHIPSNVMASALRGRWRLSSPRDQDRSDIVGNSEGDLYIETEGVVGAKYMYRMDLSLRSAGKAAARNNKLVWRGFWSYNTLTDDWAQFSLKNGKPFFFSRVKSYGVGE